MLQFGLFIINVHVHTFYISQKASSTTSTAQHSIKLETDFIAYLMLMNIHVIYSSKEVLHHLDFFIFLSEILNNNF